MSQQQSDPSLLRRGVGQIVTGLAIWSAALLPLLFFSQSMHVVLVAGLIVVGGLLGFGFLLSGSLLTFAGVVNKTADWLESLWRGRHSSQGVSVELSSPRGEGRCPFCHDSIEVTESPLQRCWGCNAEQHVSCLLEARGLCSSCRVPLWVTA